jgi:hypothetical protein
MGASTVAVNWTLMTPALVVTLGAERVGLSVSNLPLGGLASNAHWKMCEACAVPRVIHENEILRELLRGHESPTAVGEPRRWFFS